ncbi:hypothetical protein [Calycomorphotria hydatis]|uniref:Uncharacterized protein n=1 Tax=Calycomorphotria hydatis TaxID=2528027 RepID=A0A517T3S2_9PLAN|nr:hypothetical protein [Calycomorphotria hydatis]QDT63027.1 hypothetical protein V22_02260 [Calycomorphotria hydatis]
MKPSLLPLLRSWLGILFLAALLLPTSEFRSSENPLKSCEVGEERVELDDKSDFEPEIEATLTASSLVFSSCSSGQLSERHDEFLSHHRASSLPRAPPA